ncbi:hypothetical protein GQ607_006202 [Colletotrichum asianum]|uniref:Uncharacterized protein n=1 Tax=Colletotrichum asianum TaxID=702518 RepID=A0A8H3WGM0_9PEZI|nr:hypothetical protein GQ607_006202 [Colletotrichum asianum]
MDPRPNQSPLDEPDLKLKAGTLGSEQQQQPKVGSLRLGSSPPAFCSQKPQPEALDPRVISTATTTGKQFLHDSRESTARLSITDPDQLSLTTSRAYSLALPLPLPPLLL